MSFIDVNVVLEGKVRLGDRVRIGPNCFIRDAEIGDDTRGARQLRDRWRRRSAARCVIGPFARLRPAAQLERGVHVGNFVEVKKSRLGAGSKANHLTYLGDTVVGSKVNVGAGTVTCNYDGVNKSQTHIDDGAFIGSGSMLVAPVRIGAGATIGAGSTINRDAPAGKLTLAARAAGHHRGLEAAGQETEKGPECRQAGVTAVVDCRSRPARHPAAPLKAVLSEPVRGGTGSRSRAALRHPAARRAARPG